jgi:abortive infection phage resistance-like protein
MTSRLEAEGEIATADRTEFVGSNSGKTVRIDGIGGDPREADGILSVIVCDFYPDRDPVKINAQAAKKVFGHLINFVAASRRAVFREQLASGSTEAGVTVDWVDRLAEALDCHPFDLLDAPPQAKSERERALLELFRGMSDEQQDAFFQATAALAQPVTSAENDKEKQA